jgi:hypothetical protein
MEWGESSSSMENQPQFTENQKSVLAAVYAYILSPSYGKRKGDVIEKNKNTDQETQTAIRNNKDKGDNDE